MIAVVAVLAVLLPARMVAAVFKKQACASMPEARRILPDGTEEEYRREKLLEQLPFDPVPQPLPGTTDVYYVTAHSPWYAIASLAIASIFLFLTWKSKKKGECR